MLGLQPTRKSYRETSWTGIWLPKAHHVPSNLLTLLGSGRNIYIGEKYDGTMALETT